MSDLPGTNAIEYYLKGRALKQQREANESRAAIAQQQAELRAKQLEDNWKINEIKAQEIKRFHDAQIGKMKADFENDLIKTRTQLATAIQNGLLEPDPEKQGEYRLTKAGTAAKAAAEAEALREKAKSGVRVEEAQQMIPIKAQTAGEIAQAQLPAKTNEMLIRSELAGAAAKAQRDWQTIEKAKDRDAQRANTILRVNATLANKSATKEEKDQVSAQMVEDYLPDILSGAPEGVLEALPKGDAGLKLRNGVKAQGYNILTRKQAENLEGMKNLQNFYAKAKELQETINSGVIGNIGKIKQLQDELAADLVIFGREAKAEKGVVTDKDIDRLRGAIPQILPGGKGAILEGSKKANERRVNSIIDTYHEKVTGILGPKIKSEQERAIRERYGLMPRMAPSYLKRGAKIQ